MNVSIVIPAFNAAATIADTILSVVAQTRPNWEAIVVDDGSTDATAEIAGEFANRDERIRLIRQPNAGESGARNAGIGQARYDWLAFLDADDWIAPSYLELLTAELISHQELDAVHCGSVRVARDGTLVSDGYEPPAGDLFPILARRAAFPVNACIVRRSLVEAVGKFDISLKKSPDWDLWQRIARTGARFGAVRELLAYYRMAPNSSSLEAEQLLKDGLTVLRRGHSPDPRVKNPHPDYVNGLRQDKIESQEFYLLCWCAGLLLGRRKDPRRLLRAVKNDHYEQLYPKAIAQCIFDAATLPSCQPRYAWEQLWRSRQGLTEKFLLALEQQSRTPELASQALTELKEMVLKHSVTWRPVIERGEQTITRQQSLIDQLDQARKGLEEEKGRWRQLTENLEQEKLALQEKLGHSRQCAGKLEQEKASLRRDLGDSGRLAETLREEKARLEGDLVQGQQLAAKLEQEKVSLERDLGSSIRTAEHLREEKARLEEELVHGRQLAAKLEQEKVSLERDLGSSIRTAEHLREEKARLEEELVHGQQLAAKLEQEKVSLERDLGSSIRTAEHLREEKARLEEELVHGQQLAAKLEQEKVSLERDLGSSIRTAEHLREEKARLEEELVHGQQLAAKLEQENNSLKDDLYRAGRLIETLQANGRSLGTDVANLRRSINEREFVIASLQDQAWVRLGLRLRMLNPVYAGARPSGTDGDPRPLVETYLPDQPRGYLTEEDIVRSEWRFRAVGGNIANLVVLPEDPAIVRIAIAKITTRTTWDIQLNQPGFRVRSADRYALYFRARADRPRSIGVGLAKGQAPWNNLGFYKTIKLKPEWQIFEDQFVATADDDNARIHFDAGGRKVAVEISNLSFRSLMNGQSIEPNLPGVESGQLDPDGPSLGRGEEISTRRE